MKTLLHIGQAKTGTTALQSALFSARAALLEQGVLYPDFGVPGEYSHGLLTGLAFELRNGPRSFRHRTATEEAHRDRVVCAVTALKDQAAQDGLEQLVLSSEYFMRLHRMDCPKPFIDCLRSALGDRPEIVAYIRHPSRHYLSLLQQDIKAAGEVRKPRPQPLIASLEAYRDAFPQGVLLPRMFDASKLVGGDIVSDFATLLPGPAARCLTQRRNVERENVSVSAAAMVVLLEVHSEFDAQGVGEADPERRARIRRVIKIDAKLDLPRPVLKEAVADYIDHGDDSALHLRDRYGLAFPDIDYRRLERKDFLSKPPVAQGLQDLIDIDPEAIEHLRAELRRKSRSGAAGRLRKFARKVMKRI